MPLLTERDPWGPSPFISVSPVIYVNSGYSDVRIVAPSWRTSALANCTRIKPIAVAELMGGI